MWVAIDRGLRLADKRSFPCPRRNEWYQARDELYEEIMTKGWNKEKGFFGQSYENLDVLDASLLVMPLVFFACPTEPRFLATLRQIMKSPEQGGLTANNLVFRFVRFNRFSPPEPPNHCCLTVTTLQKPRMVWAVRKV